jgi:SNF2 family DNA or RNA helicase
MSDCKAYKNIVLQKHQHKVVDFMNDTKQKGLVLYHSVGSGKTLTALAVARCLLQNRKVARVIVLVPVSVVSQWEDEVRKHMPAELHDSFSVHGHERWLRKQTSSDDLTSQLINSLVIVDEAHKFRTEAKGGAGGGSQAKRLIALLFHCRKVLFLTATPIVNGFEDLRNMISIINGHEDWRSGYRQYARYKGMSGMSGMSERLQEWSRCKFSSYSVRDGDENFPMTKVHVRPFHMSQEYYHKYSKIEANLLGELKTSKSRRSQGIKFDSNKDMSIFLNGVRRAVNVIDRMSPKLEWMLQKLIAMPKLRSVVYSNWMEAGIDVIVRILKSMNMKYCVISGKTTMKARGEYVKQYNGGTLNVIIISSAGSEGLDLKGTDQVFIMEPHWNHSRIKQIIGRAVRYKSHSHLPKEQQIVHVFHLLLLKPKGVHDKLKSADDILYRMSEKKQLKIDEELKRYVMMGSIEKQRC